MKIDTMYDELVLQIQKNLLVEFNNILTVNFCLQKNKNWANNTFFHQTIFTTSKNLIKKFNGINSRYKKPCIRDLMTLGAIEKFIPINEEGFEPLCDKRIDWLLENVL